MSSRSRRPRSSPQKALEPEGGATTTKQGKAAQDDKVNAFLALMAETNPELSAAWGTDFTKVPMEHVADVTFWGHFASWLIETYTIAEGDVNGGQHLSVRPAQQAWSGAIDTARRACAKLKGEGAREWQVRARLRALPFLTYPAESRAPSITLTSLPMLPVSQEWFRRLKSEEYDEGEWFANMKKNMKRLISARKSANGERFDHSAEDIFLTHVEELCLAYALLNTGDAAARKFAIDTLWRGAGRAGEPKHLNYSTLRWNIKEGTVEMESFQSKPSKMKCAA